MNPGRSYFRPQSRSDDEAYQAVRYIDEERRRVGPKSASPQGWAEKSPPASLSDINDSIIPESPRSSASHPGLLRPIAGSLSFGIASKSFKKKCRIGPNAWDFFALDNILYHTHTLTILWDRTGQKFNKGTGLIIFCDSKILARSPNLQPLTATLP
jgi:hypothetical protein